jgi:hydroxypyruvate reductase
MRNLTQLRLAAREIFDEALRAVNPVAAVHRAVHVNETSLTICDLTLNLDDRKIYSIAIGKAAWSMALALEERAGERFIGGVIAGPTAKINPNSLSQVRLSPRWRWHEGGHPLPNNSSLEAAHDALDLLDRANSERAVVIFLMSGGGSAMLEWPVTQEISLADLREANKVLTSCGASILEINAVRRSFSAIKGGRLAARGRECDQITLIVSDVPLGEERSVASGPTLMPAKDAPSAREVITRYDLHNRLPASILHAIQSEPEASETGAQAVRKHFVLLNNKDALDAAAAAAERRGFITEIADDISDQSIEQGCKLLHGRLAKLARHKRGPLCLISGGEFSCPVRGQGIGGRNLESALRLACSTGSSLSDERAFVALCAGTDGVDGNSPAAGAIVDNTSINRAKGIGLDAADFLNRSDSYSFFVALGDVVATGATGTNVRDLRILLSNGE